MSERGESERDKQEHADREGFVAEDIADAIDAVLGGRA